MWWNIPEESEKDCESCEIFLIDFLKSHMKIEGAESIIIERAHRTGTKNTTGMNSKPRPIHAKFLNWKDKGKGAQRGCETLKE